MLNDITPTRRFCKCRSRPVSNIQSCTTVCAFTGGTVDCKRDGRATTSSQCTTVKLKYPEERRCHLPLLISFGARICTALARQWSIVGVFSQPFYIQCRSSHCFWNFASLIKTHLPMGVPVVMEMQIWAAMPCQTELSQKYLKNQENINGNQRFSCLVLSFHS